MMVIALFFYWFFVACAYAALIPEEPLTIDIFLEIITFPIILPVIFILAIYGMIRLGIKQ